MLRDPGPRDIVTVRTCSPEFWSNRYNPRAVKISLRRPFWTLSEHAVVDVEFLNLPEAERSAKTYPARVALSDTIYANAKERYPGWGRSARAIYHRLYGDSQIVERKEALARKEEQVNNVTKQRDELQTDYDALSQAKAALELKASNLEEQNFLAQIQAEQRELERGDLMEKMEAVEKEMEAIKQKMKAVEEDKEEMHDELIELAMVHGELVGVVKGIGQAMEHAGQNMKRYAQELCDKGLKKFKHIPENVQATLEHRVHQSSMKILPSGGGETREQPSTSVSVVLGDLYGTP